MTYGPETVRPQFPSLRQFWPWSGFSAASAAPLKALETKDFSDLAFDPAGASLPPFSLSSRRFLRRQCTSPIWFTRYFLFRISRLTTRSLGPVSSCRRCPRGTDVELVRSHDPMVCLPVASVGWSRVCHRGDGRCAGAQTMQSGWWLARKRPLTYAAFWVDVALAWLAAEVQGRRSSILLILCSAMRARMSVSQACGSTPLSFAVSIKV